MKADRRHELQHNELAQWLIDTYNDVIVPYWKAGVGLLIVGGIVAVLVVFGFRQSAASSAGAWNDLYRVLGSRTPADYDKVAEAHPNTEVGYWADVMSADLYLNTGCNELFMNKAEAGQDLKKAVDRYLAVREASTDPTLRERATWGLARAYEALGGTRQGQGEMDKAKALYRELADASPPGPFAAMASRRLEQLNKPGTMRFYDEFARYDPGAPPAAEGAQPGVGTSPLLFDRGSLPEEPTVPDFSSALHVNPAEPGAAPAGQTPAAAGEGAPGPTAAPSPPAATPPAPTPPGPTPPEATPPAPTPPAQAPSTPQPGPAAPSQVP